MFYSVNPEGVLPIVREACVFHIYVCSYSCTDNCHLPIHVVWTLPRTLPSAAHFGVQILPVYWDSTRLAIM